MRIIDSVKTATVIIPTFNGREKIAHCLALIEKQITDDIEIIVVVDGSVDGTAAHLGECFPHRAWLKIMEVPNQGRAEARNTGARNACGKILIFIDDDIEVGDSFLQSHLDVHVKIPRVWVTGPISQKIIDTKHKDFLLYRRLLDVREDRDLACADGYLETDFFSTQQISVSKVVFDAVGGFYNNLRDMEDFELSCRVRDTGYHIIFDTNNVVYHRDFAGIESFINRQVEHREGRQKLAVLQPDMAAKYPSIFKLGIKNYGYYAAIRKIFIFSTFWRWFVSSKVRRIFPLRLRFLVFDLLISSTVLAKLSRREPCPMTDEPERRGLFLP